MKTRLFAVLLGAASFVILPVLRADEVTDWNRNLLTCILNDKTTPLVATRVCAIVQSAVFDAVNGVERRYEPVYVPPNAPRGASKRAAAIQAAYQTLVALYPAQQPALDAQLEASLGALRSHGKGRRIADGVAWGQRVALEIIARRSADGFRPPAPQFMGGTEPGDWRPTPPGLLPGAAPQFAYMTPWVLDTQSQFRPPGPPALDSDQYTEDYIEVKEWGAANSVVRTADQTAAALFWNGSTPSYSWNSLAVRLGEEQKNSLLENAHLLALLNLAMADAAIACWEGKYHYVSWRPITAIALAASDGNDQTEPDPTWLPLLITPNHPEYPSGHSSVSGAAVGILAAVFGNHRPIWIDSHGVPSEIRTYPDMTTALEEVADARVLGGIHFRSACVDGVALGTDVANQVRTTALRPLHRWHHWGYYNDDRWNFNDDDDSFWE